MAGDLRAPEGIFLNAGVDDRSCPVWAGLPSAGLRRLSPLPSCELLCLRHGKSSKSLCPICHVASNPGSPRVCGCSAAGAPDPSLWSSLDIGESKALLPASTPTTQTNVSGDTGNNKDSASMVSASSTPPCGHPGSTKPLLIPAPGVVGNRLGVPGECHRSKHRDISVSFSSAPGSTMDMEAAGGDALGTPKETPCVLLTQDSACQSSECGHRFPESPGVVQDLQGTCASSTNSISYKAVSFSSSLSQIDVNLTDSSGGHSHQSMSDLRSIRLGSRQGSIGGSIKVVGFQDCDTELDGECDGSKGVGSASLAFPHLRKLWLGSRQGSIGGSMRLVKFSEPSEHYGQMEKQDPTKDETAWSELRSVCLGSRQGSIVGSVRSVSFLEPSEAEVPAAVIPDVSQGLKASAHDFNASRKNSLEDLRSHWLGSRQGSLVKKDDVWGELKWHGFCGLPSSKSVTFDSEVSGGADSDDEEHCEGRAVQGQLKVKQLRSIWLGSRQGSIVKGACKSLMDGTDELEEAYDVGGISGYE